jgi:hypothetical protein
MLNKGLRRSLIGLMVLVVLLGTAYAAVMWEGSSSRGDALSWKTSSPDRFSIEPFPRRARIDRIFSAYEC